MVWVRLVVPVYDYEITNEGFLETHPGRGDVDEEPTRKYETHTSINYRRSYRPAHLSRVPYPDKRAAGRQM